MPTKALQIERNFIYPHVLKLQWHITDRCNLRCSHCYQDTYNSEDLSYSQVLGIFEQYRNLLKQLNCESPFPVNGNIAITGGEPFLRDDFLDLIEVIHDSNEQITFAILTNGTLIDMPMARKLRELKASFVQVSMEGTRDTNDTIRGLGTFERSVSALSHLIRERVRTSISFTAHEKNFLDFQEVARLGLRLGVTRVWSDRLIPWGSGSTLEGLMLSSDQTRRFFEVMHAAHGEAVNSFCKTEIAMDRALQFLIAGGIPYHCGAGHTLITVQPNGDLYPCRRMPIRIGNLLEDSLVELYYKDNYLRSLRDPSRVSKGCEECFFCKKCRGGLKCLSYAVTGDPFRADPGCWLSLQGQDIAFPAGFSSEKVRGVI